MAFYSDLRHNSAHIIWRSGLYYFCINSLGLLHPTNLDMCGISIIRELIFIQVKSTQQRFDYAIIVLIGKLFSIF